MVTSLELPAPLVQDLTPLRALVNLRTLTCRSTVGYDNKAETDTAVLGSLEALETINDQPVARFWKEVKTRQADFRDFLQVVPALTAEQQLAAVAARLKAHNPGFGGQVASKIEGGVVTEIGVGGTVTDLSPLRALVGLKVLNYSEGPLSDLSPLKGMKLASLNLDRTLVQDLAPLEGMPLTSLSHRGGPSQGHCKVRDLTPLKGMPLTSLNLTCCYVGTDLTPLKGMPLTSLSVGGFYGENQVRDLEPLRGMKLTELDLGACRQVRNVGPLKGMPLTSLYLDRTGVEEMSPLKGMPLTRLSVSRTGVRDLEPLKGMRLTWLWVFEANGVTDLRPLEGMPLDFISLTSRNITQGLDTLRKMKTLRHISENWTEGGPAADYWAAYDKRKAKQ
jgi:hypothetical protein